MEGRRKGCGQRKHVTKLHIEILVFPRTQVFSGPEEKIFNEGQIMD